MSRNFNENDIQLICDLIRNWDQKKISWKSICKKCDALLGFIPTRQGLEKYSSIYQEYKNQKKALRSKKTYKPSRPAQLVKTNRILKKKIADLMRIKEANQRNLLRLEEFAYKELKMTKQELFIPLVRVDRSIIRQRSSFRRT